MVSADVGTELDDISPLKNDMAIRRLVSWDDYFPRDSESKTQLCYNPETGVPHLMKIAHPKLGETPELVQLTQEMCSAIISESLWNFQKLSATW